MHCWTLQPWSTTCVNSGCGISFGRYNCGHCHFVDDHPTKNLWHCDKCKLCRTGPPGTVYAHCDGCESCLPEETMASHRCIPSIAKSVCPVCSEDIFASALPSNILQCGHRMHSKCMKEFLAHGHTRCPCCMRTILDPDVAKREWRYIARLITAQPMPAEFDTTTADISCIDCGIKYHFFGLQCPNADCNSFNTVRLSVHNFPKYTGAMPEPQAFEESDSEPEDADPLE
jgi:hypothetical protein